MKTFSTSGTGSQQTLSEIESDKMPIYDSLTDVESDLANLSVGQIVATKDTGSELSAPVDTVQSGNMHAVTSNAVAVALSGFVKSISVNRNSDEYGNAYTGLNNSNIAIAFVADATSTGVNCNLFNSSATGNWYIHLANWDGSAVVSQPVKGTVYYI